MSVQRTVLVASLSYLATDGVERVGVRGEKVTVAAEGVQHFDWLQAGTPEAVHAAGVAAERKANAKPVKAAAPAVKADEKA